jgi:hypothetical protein
MKWALHHVGSTFATVLEEWRSLRGPAGRFAKMFYVHVFSPHALHLKTPQVRNR